MQAETTLREEVNKCLQLLDEGRLLAAKRLVTSILLNTEHVLNDELQPNELARILEARTRIEEVESITSAVGSNDSPWIHAMTLLGVTTSYLLLDNGLLRLKIEGSTDDLPLLEQVAVLREADLFTEWVPFCDQASLLHHICHNELLAYFRVSSPLLSRDAVIHAYGADCLLEQDGLVLLVVKSISEYNGVDIPILNTGFFGLNDRMIIHSLDALIKVKSPTSAELTILCTLDPKTPLPQVVTNFIIRNVAGIILFCHQRKTSAVVADPSCAHAQRIKTETNFYEDWLKPKLRAFYDFKQWEAPVAT